MIPAHSRALLLFVFRRSTGHAVSARHSAVTAKLAAVFAISAGAFSGAGPVAGRAGSKLLAAPRLGIDRAAATDSAVRHHFGFRRCESHASVYVVRVRAGQRQEPIACPRFIYSGTRSANRLSATRGMCIDEVSICGKDTFLEEKGRDQSFLYPSPNGSTPLPALSSYLTQTLYLSTLFT